MNIGILLTLFHIVLVLAVLGVLFWIGSTKILRTFREGEKKPWKKALLKIVGLPLTFIGDFFKNEKEAKLPFYLHWFNRFTRTCSRIPYFHFLPKFIVALFCELSVSFFTGHELLTGAIFLWSFSFFAFITITESTFGELEEDAITLANKIFLRTSVGVALFTIFLGNFFWKEIAPFFENGFWETIAVISKVTNGYLLMGWIGFWGLPPFFIIAALILLFIFIAISLANPKK